MANESSGWMTVYTIYSGESNLLSYSLNIIAAQGLSDKSDIDQYQLFFDQISTIFTQSEIKIKGLNTVCLLVKTSIEKEFNEQVHLVRNISSFVGVDISPHLLLIATFANPEELVLVQTMKYSGIEFRGSILNIDNSLLFANNTQQDDSHGLKRDKTNLLKSYWNMVNVRLRYLLNDFSDIEGIRLSYENIFMYVKIREKLIELEQLIYADARILADIRNQISDLTRDSKLMSNEIQERWTETEKLRKLFDEEECKRKLADVRFSKQVGKVVNVVTLGILEKATGFVSHMTKRESEIEQEMQEHQESEREREWQEELDQKRAQMEIITKRQTHLKEQIDRIEQQRQDHIKLHSDKTTELKKNVSKYHDTLTELLAIPQYSYKFSKSECIRKIVAKLNREKINRWEDIVFELENLGCRNYE